MSTYRCTACAVNWPYAKAYRNCVQCKDVCTPISNDEPIDFDDAESLRKTAEFERFYARREAKKLLEAAAEIARLPEVRR